MKKIQTIILAMAAAATAAAQERTVQNKPYIDLRPIHFGISVGINMQDIELENTGPQTITLEDGTQQLRTITCDADTWNPGFSVGVVAEARLNANLALRLTPTMHFGAKHLTFLDFDKLNENGNPSETTQDLKNTYISFPLNLKFSAPRFNNHRPYITAGISPMINLTGKDQDYVRLKRWDTMIEAGIGCDFYLPFFKIIPELKFCYSLTDCIDKNHAAELRDDTMRAYTGSVRRGRSKMIVLTFYFE